jgi:hypothetical protein
MSKSSMSTASPPTSCKTPSSHSLRECTSVLVSLFREPPITL